MTPREWVVNNPQFHDRILTMCNDVSDAAIEKRNNDMSVADINLDSEFNIEDK